MASTALGRQSRVAGGLSGHSLTVGGMTSLPSRLMRKATSEGADDTSSSVFSIASCSRFSMSAGMAEEAESRVSDMDMACSRVGNMNEWYADHRRHHCG